MKGHPIKPWLLLQFFFMNFSPRNWVIMLPLVVFLYCLLYMSGAQAQWPNKSTGPAFPALFVFGDSMVDTGNNNFITTIAKSNFPPYGKDFVDRQPTGRFSNGKVPSDFLASKLGIKELLPPYLSTELSNEDLLTGVCFASGGSGYDNLTCELASVISLADQLAMFKEYKEKLETIIEVERAAMIVAESLYIICMGSNDLVSNYFIAPIRRAQYDIPSYISFLIATASTFVEDLYNLGARKILVVGTPPLGCLPSQRTLFGGQPRDCVELINEVSQNFNNALSMEIGVLQEKLSTKTVIYADIFKKALPLIQYPSKYGFEVSTNGCCGTGEMEVSILCNNHSITCDDDSKYVFWDSYHPTEKTYEIVVDGLIEEEISTLF